MKTLTVIIPVYNGERYISRCLKSILLQEYAGLKVIVIDDGSKDNSREAVDNAVKKYNRYGYDVTVVSQENTGVAATRNRGIELADTDYVAFADQDDWFVKDFVCEFMSYVDKVDHDMVIGGFCRVNDKGRVTRKLVPKDCEWSKFCLTYPWGRIIRREFLVENNISFLKTGIGEDVYFDLVAYSYTKDIVMATNCKYVWFDNPISVSNVQYTAINEKTNPLFTFERILEDVKDDEYRKGKLLEYYFIKFTVWFLLTNMRKSRKDDLKRTRQLMVTWLKENYPDYMNNPYLSPFRPEGDLWKNRMAVWGCVKVALRR